MPQLTTDQARARFTKETRIAWGEDTDEVFCANSRYETFTISCDTLKDLVNDGTIAEFAQTGSWTHYQVVKVHDPIVTATGQYLFKKSEIDAAWNAIQEQNKAQDWRDPISVRCNSDEYTVNLWIAAIQFFTATQPTLKVVNNMVVMKSVGYRGGPAGDH